MWDEPLVLAGRSFTSRLIVGTGKYKDVEETRLALEAASAEMVTVAVRRVDLSAKGGGSMMELLGKYTILPNTAGCYTAEEAVRGSLEELRQALGW